MLSQIAHVTASDLGFGLGLFLLGVTLGAYLVARLRRAAKGG